MRIVIDLAWLIPLLPLVGALLIAVLLIIFNRTMFRLSKLIGNFLLFCFLGSAVLSYLLLGQELTSEIVEDYFLDWSPAIDYLRIHIGIHVDKHSAINLSVLSSVTLLLMLYIKKYLKEARGSIISFLLISFFGSAIFMLPLSPFVRELAFGLFS